MSFINTFVQGMPKGKFKKSKEHIEALQLGRKIAFEKLAVYKKCPVCGVTKRRSRSLAHLVFCSKDCSQKNWKLNIRPKIVARKLTEEEKERKRKRVKTHCQFCNKLFEHCPSQKRKFCSEECFYKNGRIDVRGENNWNYKHGLSKTRTYKTHVQKIREYRKRGAGGSYTMEEWNKLKEESNFTCKMCKLKEPEIRLTADHIIPISKGGNSYIENIQPLCSVCNSRKNNAYLKHL